MTDYRMLILVHPDNVQALSRYADSDLDKVELRISSLVGPDAVVFVNRETMRGQLAPPIIWPRGLAWPP